VSVSCAILVAMATWKDVENAEPEFAERVRRLFDAHKHKTIATLRADGSPRLSGIEAEFDGGELTFGSMPAARKGADLHRDPRFALHSATVDPPDGEPAGWSGDAKIAGLAHKLRDLDGDNAGELFHADIGEVVFTGLNEDATALVIESWRPGRGLRRTERA
jgi:Pyridoxamine 5'-phosphate oxidase